jgi:hypothetical protein
VTALRIFLARLLGLFGSGTRRDRELRAEINGHIAEAAAEYVRQGMTPEEARYAALRQFGGVTQTIEAHRDQRRFTFFSTLRQDVQYAVRTLIRAPGFAIIAVLTLTIGILGNTTIFSGVNALLFTPLPAERPEQIAQILPAGRPGGSTRSSCARLIIRQGMLLTTLGLAVELGARPARHRQRRVVDTLLVASRSRDTGARTAD